MSGLDNLKNRLRYNGGANQVNRMNIGKLNTLKKALLYSYQAATAILDDSREFRCLINPNKMSNDVDDKIISIPFADVCLNKIASNKIEKIGLKPGDVFTWKENNTHWIVTLQYKNETAYFRAQIRECKETIEINGNRYWCYIRGPVEQTIQWAQKNGTYFNDLNYTLFMYITKNEETEAFFHRFSKIKIANKMWEVQAIDNISVEGLIEVYLKETFQNTIEEEYSNKNEEVEIEIDKTRPYIDGKTIVRPYDIIEYMIINAEGGGWRLDDTKDAIISSQDGIRATVEIISGKSGNIVLNYDYDTDKVVTLPIEIKSL